MSRQIQFRRGTADEHAAFIGAIGEVTVDTTNKTLRVHDGETPGGVALARADAETDLGGSDFVTEWQTPTAENNYTWYRKYQSGWVEQGGRSQSQSITLPVEMADDTYQILLTGSCSVSNNNVTVWGFRDKTKFGFYTQGNIVNNSSGSVGANTSVKYWYVFGMFATL